MSPIPVATGLTCVLHDSNIRKGQCLQEEVTLPVQSHAGAGIFNSCYDALVFCTVYEAVSARGARNHWVQDTLSLPPASSDSRPKVDRNSTFIIAVFDFKYSAGSAFLSVGETAESWAWRLKYSLHCPTALALKCIQCIPAQASRDKNQPVRPQPVGWLTGRLRRQARAARGSKACTRGSHPVFAKHSITFVKWPDEQILPFETKSSFWDLNPRRFCSS